MAQDPITVAGTEINGLLEEGPSGPFHDIYQELTLGIEHSALLQVAPIKRATRQFLEKKAQCLYVGSELPSYYTSLGLDVDELVISNQIFRIRIQLFGPKGTAPIEELGSLRGKTIAIDSGVGGVEFIAKTIAQDMSKVLVVQSSIQGFQLLEAGRVAALVAIDIDVEVLKAHEPMYAAYPASKSFFIHESSDVMVCHRSQQSERFVAHINQRLDELRAEQGIKNIMDRYIQEIQRK
jgi:hypothetical protein